MNKLTIRPQRPPSIPEFRVYICQWAECSAGLHNYETLHYHVLKVHRNKLMASGEFPYPCKWKGYFKPLTNEEEKHEACTENHEADKQRLLSKFKTEQKWEAHVRDHLIGVKKGFGLGPACGICEPFNIVVDFRYDAEDRQRCTPWITPAPPGDVWTPPPGFEANEAFNRLHGIN
ncbi:hypothetical protein RUND412_006948 [Rhizina undulata]